MDADRLVELGDMLRENGKGFIWRPNENPSIWREMVQASMDEIIWLYSMHLPHQMRLVSAGSTIAPQVPRGDPAALRAAIHLHAQAGYTIVCNELELLSAPVARYVARCSELLKARCSSNLYGTPPHAQGFAEHEDHQDISVLQLAGEKTWTISDVDGARRIVTLRPGHALYLPRGTPHSATTSASASVHLTISAARVSLDDLIEAVMTQLAIQRPQMQGLAASSLQVDDEGLTNTLRELFSGESTMHLATQLFHLRRRSQTPGEELGRLFGT